MRTVSRSKFRRHYRDVLRRVEAGGSVTVTVAGRPVAELHPAPRRRWVSGPALADVWRGPTPHSLEGDLERLDTKVTDPFPTA